MPGLLIGLIVALFVWRTVKEQGGNPLWWTIGTLVIWPVFATIVGFRYRNRGLTVIGLIGITIIVISAYFYVTALRRLKYDVEHRPPAQVEKSPAAEGH